MIRYFKTLLLLGYIFSSAVANSAVFTATGNGNWNLGTTWGGACGAGCTAGIDYPGAADDAIIPSGISVTVPFAAGGFQCRNLQLDPNTAGSVNIALPFVSLTVNGTLIGYTGGSPSPPNVAGVVGGAGQLIFTGSNVTGLGGFGITNEVIAYWNTNSPLPTTQFNLGVNTGAIDWIFTPGFSATAIEFAGNVTVNSGTLQFGSNAITDFRMSNASATLTIASGATFNLRIPATNNGTATTKINTVIINGTTNLIDSDSYLNSEIFTLASGGVLNIGFSGTDQTGGWWYQSTAPTGTITINAASTINFNANADQNLPAGAFGNLTLDAPVSTATKTLVGSGSLSVSNTFTINSGNVTFTSSNNNQASFQGDIDNNGTWTTISNQDIQFNGSSTQAIGGSNAITFNDNVIFANSSGVDFNVNITFTSTITDNNNPITFTNDFTFTGATYNQGAGLITFDGNTQQVAGSGDINFEDVTLTSTTLNINATNASLCGLLSMSNSTLDADGSGSGSFTLVSNAIGTAAVGNMTGSTANGNWIVQRYFDGSGDVWRNFGVAVTGSTVSGDIVGSGFTINGNDLAHYDESETILGGIDDGWVNQTTFGNSLSNSRGYSMWTRDTEITNTVDFTGTLNTGNRNMIVSRSSTGNSANDGWNLVNNPYASTVDWDLMSRGNLNGTVSVWNTATGVYDAWNGSTGDLSGGLIASGQSFWVHSTSGTPTLTITEADKSTSSTSFLRSSGLTNHLIVSLLQEEKIDKTYIHFIDIATDDFDNDFDGLKLNNGIYNLSSIASSGESLSINSLPFTGCDKIIKLNMTNIGEGAYQLKFDGLVSFDAGFEFTLKDNFLTTSTILEEGVLHDFSVTDDAASWGNTRFEIEIAPITLPSEILYEIVDECNFASSLTITNAQAGVTYTLSQNGVDFVTKQATSQTLLMPLTADQVKEGINAFDLTLINGSCGNTTIGSAIEFTINPIDAGTIQYESSIECDNTTLVTINNAQVGVTYTLIQNGVDLSVIKATSNQLVFPLTQSQVNDGLNKFDLDLSNGSCPNALIQNALEFTTTSKQEISSVIDNESCGDGQVLLKAEGATGNAYYSWYETVESIEPILGEISNEFLTPLIETTRFYYVAIINEVGCESIERVKVSATIKTPPSADFLYQESTPCELSTNLVLTNTEIGATYNLMQNGQVIVTATSNEASLILPLTEQQVLEGINAFDIIVQLDGCSTEVTNAIEISYYSTQEIISVQNGSNCEPGQVSISAQGATGNATYNWYETIDSIDPILNQHSDVFITPIIEISTSYFVSIINENGCKSVQRVEVIAEINPIENPTTQNGSTCNVGNVVLKAEGAMASGSYNWYETMAVADPIPDENKNQFTTPVLEATRKYYVSIVNEFGCESPERVEVIAEIIILDKPDIQLQEDVVSTSVIADSYRWFKEEVLLENEINQSLVVFESGNYAVEITVDGCSAVSESIPVEILGLKELNRIGISIYPNPVVEVVNITNSSAKIKSIIIYDSKGVAVFRSGKIIPTEINLRSIKNGIYIINIVTDNKTINYRVRKK